MKERRKKGKRLIYLTRRKVNDACEMKNNGKKRQEIKGKKRQRKIVKSAGQN